VSDVLTTRAAVEWRTERDKTDPLPPLSGDDTRAEAERRTASWVLGHEQAAGAAEVQGANSPRFRLIAFNDIKPDKGAHYLIKGLFPRSGLAVVWGPPKCGKSFWTFDALMHVALDWIYRGRRVTGGAVVYCALEGVQGFKNRIEAFRREKLVEADSGSPPFYLMPASLSLVADHAALIADIRNQLGDTKPAAVCLDTLNRSLKGSESSDEDMAAYIRAADAIRDAFDCLVVVVHHCGHSGERPRGHSSLIGALDVQIAIRRDVSENITAELELSKDSEVGLQFVSRLKVVDLGPDQDGDSITSCIIEAVEATTGSTKASKPAKLTKSATNALRALKEAIGDLGEIPPASNHIPAGVRTVSVEVWREYAYRMGISTSDEPRAKQKAFKDGSETLIAAKIVAIWEPHVWLATA
jgi:hypothetical protein